MQVFRLQTVCVWEKLPLSAACRNSWFCLSLEVLTQQYFCTWQITGVRVIMRTWKCPQCPNRTVHHHLMTPIPEHPQWVCQPVVQKFMVDLLNFPQWHTSLIFLTSVCNQVSPYLEPKRGHLSSSDTFQSRSSHEEFRSEPQEGSSNNGISPGPKTSSHRNSWHDQMESNTRMHYLQTFPMEESLLSQDRDQLAMEYRRQATLPAQRSLLQEQYRALPLPLRASIDSEVGGKPRSFTLPRDSGLHAILAATAASDQGEPQHYPLDRSRDAGQIPYMNFQIYYSMLPVMRSQTVAVFSFVFIL